MRRWTALNVSSIVWQTGSLRAHQARIVRIKNISHFRHYSHQFYEARRPQVKEYAIFNKVQFPGDDLDGWCTLLDAALPQHLRVKNSASPPAVSLYGADIAELLLSAQYPTVSAFSDQGFDLLYQLASKQGRWEAAVWLAKTVIESFPSSQVVQHDVRLPSMVGWIRKGLLLDDLVRSPIELDPAEEISSAHSSPGPTLHEITSDTVGDNHGDQRFRHHALGQIWRSLGAMTQACVGGEIRTEILEIIAILHHHQVMPPSIYEYDPRSDNATISQSPLLALLSSRILTSLSDAAWKAHESRLVAAAKANEGKHVPLRPEIPGSVYRVRIPGLRPEVWMELILWSCLNGGWVFEGLAILRAVFGEGNGPQPKWKPVLHRTRDDDLHSSKNMRGTDSNMWNDLFMAISTAKADPTPPVAVDRTVSAEVINAYVDALVSTLSAGVGLRGTEIEPVTKQLHMLKKFLSRSNLHPSSGTWDALILRLIESQSLSPERNSGALRKVIELSSGFGQGLNSGNSGNLPAYVLDGNGAIQGLLHRALLGRVAAGSLRGSLAVFEALQQRSDTDKRASLMNFMSERTTSLLHKAVKYPTFTSNFPGIEYPAFDLHIPPFILGRFLNLVVDAKAYDFGRWLLYNDDVDGPVIGESMYQDPNVQPALTRFAIETNDSQILSKIKGQRFQIDALRSILDNRVNARRWDAVTTVLQVMCEMGGRTWEESDLANLARTMLLIVRDIRTNALANDDLLKAKEIFVQMVRGEYEQDRPLAKLLSVQTLLVILSSLSAEWAKFCEPLHMIRSHVRFTSSSTTLNLALEGIAAAYGSAGARLVLETFWPPSVRNAHAAGREHHFVNDARSQTLRFRPQARQSLHRQRNRIRIAGENVKEFVILGGPDLTPPALLSIINKALEELSNSSDHSPEPDLTKLNGEDLDRQASRSPRSNIFWALRRLRDLPSLDQDALRELRHTLLKHGLDDALAELSALGEQDATGDSGLPQENDEDAIDAELIRDGRVEAPM